MRKTLIATVVSLLLIPAICSASDSVAPPKSSFLGELEEWLDSMVDLVRKDLVQSVSPEPPSVGKPSPAADGHCSADPNGGCAG
jgi:hypothetical protein